MSLSVSDIKYSTNKVVFGTGYNNSDSASAKKKATVSPSAKILLGAALAGLAVGGYYLVTRGKHSSKIDTDTIFDTLEQFRQKGKFVKGEALLSDGSKYTGTIKYKNSKAQEVVLTYKDGRLKRSDIEGKITRLYVYDNNILRSIVHGDFDRMYSAEISKYFVDSDKRIALFITANQPRYNRIISKPGKKGIDYAISNGKFTKFDENNKPIFTVKNGGSIVLYDDLSNFKLNDKNHITSYHSQDIIVKDDGTIYRLSDGEGEEVIKTQIVEPKEIEKIQSDIKSKIRQTASIFRTQRNILPTNEQLQQSPRELFNNWYDLINKEDIFDLFKSGK